MNKKGQATAILVWMILAFITVLFFGAYIYGFNRITTTLINMDNIVGDSTTIGSVAEDTFGKINTAQTTGLHLLAFVIIVTSALSILITNFIMKSHPVFLIVHIFITIGAVMASTILSNTYEGLLDSGVLAETLAGFTASNFIMLNLPVWVVVIGIFGAIFLFAGVLRDAGAGGSVL